MIKVKDIPKQMFIKYKLNYLLNDVKDYEYDVQLNNLINKYKAIGLDRVRYEYDDYLLLKMDRIITFIYLGKQFTEQVPNIDDSMCSFRLGVSDYIFDLKKVVCSTNLLYDESIYYDDRIKLKEYINLLQENYQNKIIYYIKKVETIFDDLEVGLSYNKELEAYLKRVK